jgi:hypothetical protein
LNWSPPRRKGKRFLCVARACRAASVSRYFVVLSKASGQIMSVLGPAQFGARVQEQRDKLATLAKTLGVKPAQ